MLTRRPRRGAAEPSADLTGCEEPSEVEVRLGPKALSDGVRERIGRLLVERHHDAAIEPHPFGSLRLDRAALFNELPESEPNGAIRTVTAGGLPARRNP